MWTGRGRDGTQEANGELESRCHDDLNALEAETRTVVEP
jgi:hypothetical protein